MREESPALKFKDVPGLAYNDLIFGSVAAVVLLLHGSFILWVIFGGLLTRSRPYLRWLHILSLVWGIMTELLPWPCPLTVLENWFEAKPESSPIMAGFYFTTWTN
jgi:hypothetical protein